MPPNEAQPAKNMGGKLKALVVVLFVLFLGTGAAAGYYYMQASKSAEAAQSQDAQKAEDKKTKAKDSTKIYALPDPITINTVEDLDKLPSYTPESFKHYLSGRIDSQFGECVLSFSIKNISGVNISGGVGSVNAETFEAGTGECGGGAMAIWYLKDDLWFQAGFQAVPSCEFLETTTIKSEFLDECFADANAETMSKNPNGSIKD